jgi:hypothetical protein
MRIFKTETARRASETLLLSPNDVVAHDVDAMQQLGQCTAAQFAVAIERDKNTAFIRLGRLVDAGLATRWRGKDTRSYRYALTTKAGAITGTPDGRRPVRAAAGQEAGE